MWRANRTSNFGMPIDPSGGEPPCVGVLTVTLEPRSGQNDPSKAGNRQLKKVQIQFPECFIKAHLNSSFVGLEMSQAWHDLALWEECFNQAQVKSVVEFAPLRGGMICHHVYILRK
jgi:hypothetical protein